MRDDKHLDKQLDNIELMLHTLQDLWRDQEYRDHLCEEEHAKVIGELRARVRGLEFVVKRLINALDEPGMARFKQAEFRTREDE